MILVVSTANDNHTKAVVSQLGDLGATSVRLNLASFPEQAQLTIREASGSPRAEINIPGHGRIDLRAVQAIWWRRPEPFQPAASIQDPVHREFVYREWYEALAGLWPSLSVRWVNVPQCDEFAGHKTYQLALARRIGLSVPPTCVTNDPDAAREFLGQHGPRRVIFKKLSATSGTWRPTRFVSRGHADHIAAVRHAPVVFQEYVPGVDVRVTVVGDHYFSSEIDARATSSPEDWRPVWREAQITPCVLPVAIEEALRAIVGELGLLFAAIDLRRRDDGEYVFLEVNPSGQWLFVEERTGQPITAAVARLLAAR